jgi:hypothetical protein
MRVYLTGVGSKAVVTSSTLKLQCFPSCWMRTSLLGKSSPCHEYWSGRCKLAELLPTYMPSVYPAVELASALFLSRN